MPKRKAAKPTKPKRKSPTPGKTPLGRNSTYTEEKAQKILQAVSDGVSLRTTCDNDEELPTVTTIFNWLADPKYCSFLERYERARGDAAEQGFEKITQITQQLLDGEIEPNQARVAIDAIKWQLGKLKPNKYSDKIQIDNDHNITIEVVNYQPRIESKPKLVGNE